MILPLRRLATLAAALAPDRAGRLLALVASPHAPAAVELATRLAARPRAERVQAVAQTLAPAAGAPLDAPPAHVALRRLWRERRCAARSGRPRAGLSSHPFAPAPAPGARSAAGTALGNEPTMASPWSLPPVSAALASLTHASRETGCIAAAQAAAAVAELLGVPVAIAGTVRPSQAGAAGGMARAAFSLEALGAVAVLEVEARLVARSLERLGGGTPRTPAALAPMPAEQALLDLAALTALDALRGTAAEALAPRLCAGEVPARPDATGAGSSPLVVDLELTVGEERGRGRLLVPAAALRALAGPAPEVPQLLADLELSLSLRDGVASLAPEDLAALAMGDVLLLDEGSARQELVVPGGLALLGRAEGDLFHVEELNMTETQASYPLTVSVEVARVTVTFGELARLEPGSVLPLDIRRDGAVVLRAGERAIARGQLVDMEGALGVRILELGDPR